MKTVLFFGFYDRKYSRNKVLMNGFQRLGWKVDECNVDPRRNVGLGKYWTLFMLGLKARNNPYDLVLVAFPGHNAVWLARILFGRGIIFDAFLSNYDANLDRKLYTAGSWRAKKDKLLDTWSCKLAYKVLLDTNALKEYFVQEFGLKPESCIAVPIGADDTVFFPTSIPEEATFTVHFHGTFIPLQGLEHIVEAASILRDDGVRFRIVGGGQEAAAIDSQIEKLELKSFVERVQKVPVDQIPGYMAGAHIVLGIFGDVERAKRAVPNKVYEAMAMGKAIITEDCRGIHEVPDARDAFLLVPPGDGTAIAKAIRKLKADESKRSALARKALDIFETKLRPEHIVRDLLAKLSI